MLNIQNLIDEAKCDETVRELRWPEGIRCAPCDSEQITQQGRDTTQPHRQQYRCQQGGRYVDALTGTVLAEHHQPLRIGMLCLYLRGLNRSNQQIAHALGLHKDDVQRMTEPWWDGVVARQPAPGLSGEVECDAVSGVAGPKGPPKAVKKRPSGAPAAAEGGPGTRPAGEGKTPASRGVPPGW